MPLLLAVALLAPVPEKPAPVVYHAYWLEGPPPTNEYQLLLVTAGPLATLSERKLPDPKLALDHPAFTFATHQRDSLWADPFRCLPGVGKVGDKTVALGEKTYTFEEVDVREVVKLLEAPLGTLTVHRRAHPLAGAEQSAKAFAGLLKEQIAAKK